MSRRTGKEFVHSKKWLKRKYKAYVKGLIKRADSMINRGLTPHDAIPAKFRDWEIAYTAERNDRIDEVQSGERASIGDINAKLISDQVYELSEAKAYAIFEYMKTLSPEEREGLNFSFKNINVAIAKIRTGEFVSDELGLWDKIRDLRAKLFEEGKSKEEVRKIVSQTFFYPKEKKK